MVACNILVLMMTQLLDEDNQEMFDVPVIKVVMI